MVIAVTVFLIVLGLQFFRKFLTEYVALFLNQSSSGEKQLATTLRELRNELSQINAQHEFAKYAKLKRLISKHEDELRSQGLQRQKHGLKIKGVLWTVGMVFTIVCHSWVVWKYRTAPLVELPTEWLAPLNPILKFPTNVDGAIGLPAWLVISNSVIFQLQRVWSP